MANQPKIKVCVAGATRWAGSELAKAIAISEELELVAAISRQHAGKSLNEVLDITGTKIPVFATIEEALTVPCDVLVEYTKPDIAKHHILTAIAKGVNVVVGTSGLSDEDYEEIGIKATAHQQSVLAVGNFAISVVLLNKFAEMAAQYMSNWEIIDYASAGKIDAPSGSARELAYRLSQVKKQELQIPIENTRGVKETRGADLNGTRVHSLRLPGFVISLETIFGMPDEKLTLKHEAGNSSKPYVTGAFLAIKMVSSFTGLKRGLDSVMDL
jgi:4-hydroxy-tetrahydrodipicolinate reductase